MPDRAVGRVQPLRLLRVLRTLTRPQAPRPQGSGTGFSVRYPVLLTRRVPAAVMARLEAECELDLYDGREAIPRSELLTRVVGKQASTSMLL